MSRHAGAGLFWPMWLCTVFFCVVCMAHALSHHACSCSTVMLPLMRACAARCVQGYGVTTPVLVMPMLGRSTSLPLPVCMTAGLTDQPASLAAGAAALLSTRQDLPHHIMRTDIACVGLYHVPLRVSVFEPFHLRLQQVFSNVRAVCTNIACCFYVHVASHSAWQQF